jgi:hypothetical protein
MTEKKKNLADVERLDLVRDIITCTGVFSIGAGAAIQFGVGFGLLAFGATVIALLIVGQVLK